MKIRIKKIKKDVKTDIPKYAKNGDAGLDLVATSIYNQEGNMITYGTNLAIEIPEGYEGQVRPRSSIKNYDLRLVNSPGTIDSGYRGEILVTFKIEQPLISGYVSKVYTVGERIAQLLIKESPHIELIEVDEINQTERGDNKWGSSGK